MLRESEWRQMLILLDAFRRRLVGNRKLDRLPIYPRYPRQALMFASFREIARFRVVDLRGQLTISVWI